MDLPLDADRLFSVSLTARSCMGADQPHVRPRACLQMRRVVALAPPGRERLDTEPHGVLGSSHPMYVDGRGALSDGAQLHLTVRLMPVFRSYVECVSAWPPRCEHVLYT